MANNKVLTYTIEVNDKGKVKIEGLQKSFTNLNTSVKALNADLIKHGEAISDVGKKNQNMIDKTGLAGATVQELGRTISDANYGIRGMANNLQQLSSLFVTLVSTTGGVTNGLQKMWEVLRGPLGIVIAFQTVITLIEGGIIKFNILAKEQEALNKALREGGKNAGEEAAQLNILIKTASNAALTTEQRQTAIDKLNQDYPEYLGNIDLEKIGTEELNIAIAKQIELITKRSQAEAITAAIQEEQSKILEEQNKSTNDRTNLIGKGITTLKNLGNVSKAAVDEAARGIEKSDKRIEDSTKTIDFLQEQLQKLYEETPSLVDALYGDEDKQAKDDKTAEDAEERRQKKIQSLLERYRKAVAIDDSQDKITQLEQQRDFAIKEAEQLQAGEELKKLIRDDFAQKIEAERLAQAERDNAEDERQARLAERARLRNLKIAEEYIRIQQNRLKAEQSIEMQRVGFASQVAGILSSIAKEGSTLAKVALAVEKGAAIADIVIRSQQSIATQTANKLAADMKVRAFYAGLGPFGLAPMAAELAANQALYTKGVATTKIGAGLSIASILATTLSSGGKGIQAPSAGAAPAPVAPQIQAPAFNVVGATQTSQLAQTISQAEQQPIKAYVVASDVTTAQELERSTIEGASIG